VAKLVPYVERKKRKLGGLEGKIWLAPDWDSDETNEAIWKEFWDKIERDPDAEAPPR
jgi:hypothetical protein